MTLRAGPAFETDDTPEPAPTWDRPTAPPHPAAPGRFTVRQDRAIQWWSRAPDNLRGSVLMLASFLAFAVMTAAIKGIGDGLPLPQVLVIRQVIMTALLAPLFLPDIGGALETRHVGLQFLRGMCSLGAMLFGFTAVIHVPLADVTALGFSQVLFVTIAAVLILKESVGPRRWVATGIGFVGVLIMLRPGSGALDPYALLAVAGAGFGAGITITVRMLAQVERTATILLYQAIILIAAMLPPTIQWWTPPTPFEWLMLVLIGTFGTAGQFLITKAYQAGEAAALAPLDFVRLLLAVAIGFFIFAEVPDAVSFAGAALVVGATIYTMRRNAVRKAPLPPAAP
jgi:drug/metabolite transporter (DMT)-like permease